MKELSIFIDESGDFGEYSSHSPYYIITMVFHNQDADITKSIEHLDNELGYLGISNLCIHTGPIIRKEEIYKNMDVVERRRIFNKMMAFIRSIDIYYKCFYIEKNILKIRLKLPVSFQSRFHSLSASITMIFLLLMMLRFITIMVRFR